MTRWQDYCLIFGHLQQRKIANILSKFCQSGEISPNLVTLSFESSWQQIFFQKFGDFWGFLKTLILSTNWWSYFMVSFWKHLDYFLFWSHWSWVDTDESANRTTYTLTSAIIILSDQVTNKLLRNERKQCDQKARLVVEYLAVYNSENWSNSIKVLPK